MKVILLSILIAIVSIGVFDAFASSKSTVESLGENTGWGFSVVDPISDRVFVSNFRSDTVSIIDGKSNEIIEKITVGDRPYGLGYNYETENLYIARERDNLLVVTNATNHITDNIEIPEPYDIAVNSKTNKVYITSDGVHKFFVLNGETNQIDAEFDIGDPCGVILNESTNTVYVTSESTNQLVVIDGNTNEIVSQGRRWKKSTRNWSKSHHKHGLRNKST